MAENKDIKYLNQDFNSFKENLINYTKTYFPNTFNDFSPSSPGMMFMELASYIGDILSFYLNNQIQETFLQYARQESNLYNLAYMFGYKPKITTPSIVEIDFYQTVPAILINSEMVPDFNYSLILDENSQISTNGNNNIKFLVQDKIDFSFSSSLDPTEVSVYSVVGNEPSRFLLKKTRQAQSSVINNIDFTFTNPQSFSTIEITGNDIIGVLDIKDSEGNIWYEVDYLAQDVVFDSIKNTNFNDPNFSDYGYDVPYLLKLKQVERRFVTRFKDKNTLQIQFGAGTVNDQDEEIIPNSNNVGLGLTFEKDKLTTAFSPVNFLFTDSYGIAPSNITLTIRYLTGGGIESNIQSYILNTLSTDTLKFGNSNLGSNTIAQEVFDSFALSNPKAADGGSDGDNIEEIRQNSISQFTSQLRAVTEQDYIIRTLSLPSKYGSIAKVFCSSKKMNEMSNIMEKSTNIELYILSYNNQKQLNITSKALKNNVKTYLSQYRMIGDSIEIKNAYIINIGIDFDIIILPNYNSNEVIIKCIESLKNYFNIDKWQINQPILLKDLYILLDSIKGVQTVKDIKITNKAGVPLGYSEYGYDIEGATLNNVIYPSLDPSIFEIKYPDIDIKGRVSSF
jgi:hypothetical protein